MPTKSEPLGSTVSETTIQDQKHSIEVTRLQKELFAEGIVSRKILDAVPSPLLIINEEWQVVYANGAVLSLVGGSSDNPRAGLTEGEAFHCVHPCHNKDSERFESCQVCAVARLLSRSLKGEEVSEDCHLTCDLTGTSVPLDLRVWATPLEFHGEFFSILSLVDISDKRRKKLLENACYHDLLNTLTSIKGVLAVMKDGEVEEQGEICELLETMTQDSIDEIISLRLLEQAEKRVLKPHLEPINTLSFLSLVRDTYQHHPAAEGKSLLIAEDTTDQLIESDPQLMRRITGNMVINALEATVLEGKVFLGCRNEGDGVRLWVNNAQKIPYEIQCQIFERDASTKGHGRGVGTYSIKILSSILGGEPHFTSTESDGTTFSLWLPRQKSR